MLVLIYGGLRGALGLCLALMVGVDEDVFSLRLREIVVFNMASVATLTLLVNGTTTGFIVRYLEMIKVSPIKTKLNQNIVQQLVIESYGMIKDLKV